MATITKSVGEARDDAGEAGGGWGGGVAVRIKKGFVVLKRNSLYLKRLGVSQ